MEENELIKEIGAPLFLAKGWLKLLGVLSIIGGVIAAMTVIGIIVCWLPIWMGVLLFKAGNSLEEAHYSGDKAKLTYSFTQLKTYFTINGVLTLICLFSVALAFIGTILFSWGLSNFWGW